MTSGGGMTGSQDTMPNRIGTVNKVNSMMGSGSAMASQ